MFYPELSDQMVILQLKGSTGGFNLLEKVQNFLQINKLQTWSSRLGADDRAFH